MFLPIHIKVIRFCSEEIARQGDSPERVWQLVDAWNEAYIDSFVMRFARVAVTEHQIKHWHFRAMKHMVRHGYRNVALTKSDGIGIGAPISEIPRLMTQLVNAQHDMLPAEFYKEFEEIHPFLDGNGRVGKIIYNYLLGTLDDPQLPPDYWK